jgi:hypothetical protein
MTFFSIACVGLSFPRVKRKQGHPQHTPKTSSHNKILPTDETDLVP